MFKQTTLKEWIISSLILICMVVFVITNYNYRDKYHLKVISFEKIKNQLLFKDSVKATLTPNMGKDMTLRMDVVFPCNNREQHAEIKDNMSAIISDFLIESDQTEMERWIKDRDLKPVKNRLVSIANRYTHKPVSDVLFENLLW